MSDQSEKRLEIAVYGKGGIGKSTVSANLSAALASAGMRVMQIGCDPKHDSTRLLMHGENIPTVLEYLRTVDKKDGDIHAVLKTGFGGVGCIEAGGPRPGVGCAGRGIISAFEFLEQQNAKDPYNLVLYDVLGDVVCGGFAVPVRREYADAIFLVTSGEFMALYAANNILRGVYNFDGDRHSRVAGIIYNERKVTDEDARVRRFAEAVGLPIVAKIPRSNAFAVAEQQGKVLMEMEEYPTERAIFSELARKIRDDLMLYPAKPLEDAELENVILRQNREDAVTESVPENISDIIAKTVEPGDVFTGTAENSQEFSGKMQRSVRHTEWQDAVTRRPLYGCAFNGAATAAVNLTDAVIIAHSPRACAFYTWQNISSPGRKNLFNRGVLMPSALSPHFTCTEMDQADVVFGGIDRLRKAVLQAMEQKPGAVVIISSCVSGIIGDPILRMEEELSTPELPIIAIPADGDIAGDYMEGIRICMHAVAEHLIDRSVTADGRSINLIGEAGVGNNLEINHRILQQWMDAMDIRINCRFLGGATVHEMQNFQKASVNILASDSADNRDLKEWLTENYQVEFLEETLPVGFDASCRWLRKIGAMFRCEEKAEALIAGQEVLYRAQIEQLRAMFSGKKVFMTTINTGMDWFLDVLREIGAEVVFIGVLNYLSQPVKVTNHPESYRIDENFNGDKTAQLLKELKPDIVLANYLTPADEDPYLVDSMPMSPPIGFFSGIQIVQRWPRLMRTSRKGGWMNDRKLFEKYFS